MHRLNDPDQVVKTDRWSRYQWERHLEASNSAAEVIQRGAAKVYSFPRFGGEVFQRLYADAADRVERVKPEDQWAANAHDELAALPDFDRLRRR
jgi:hypothetical protein